MTGYVRQDVTNQIANGNTVDAIPLDQEFDGLQAAFASVGGHNHSGAIGEGAPITVIGPAQDIVASGNSLTPKTDNSYDLGTATFEWKDLWIDGIANIDSLVADTADINAGTIDNTVIGATTPAAITGTTITATSFVGPLTGNATTATSATTAGSAATLTTPRTINGTSFNGSANITTANWGTSRTITIGSTGKAVDGSAAVSWTLGELGVGTLGTQNSNAVTITGGSISGITDLAVADGGTGVSTITGLIRGNGTSPFTAAIAGTDFLAPAAIGTTVQAFDSTLSALAAYNTNGLLTQTAADTFTGRTITGGGIVSVTNGDGVSGNPTITVPQITTTQIDAATLVTASEGIAGSNNDTTIPTTAAVRAHNITIGTSAATTSGVSVDITGLPSWAKRITVMVNQVSTNGISPLVLRLGTSGGVEATGYVGGAAYSGASNTLQSITTGFPISVEANTAAGSILSGAVTFHLFGSNTWVAAGAMHESGVNQVGNFVAGLKTLAGALDRVRITTVGGTATFDAGSINVSWE